MLNNMRPLPEGDLPQLTKAACASAASFIIGIDAASGDVGRRIIRDSDVAAYLEQRFGLALRALYFREGRAALVHVVEDGRSLPAR